MNHVIRVRNQKVYESLTSAAADMKTPYNYLAKCIRAKKPCKGEYFEFYQGEGRNSPPEALPRLIAQSKIKEPIEEDHEWEDSIQSILSVMKDEAEKFDISLDEMYKGFIKRTRRLWKITNGKRTKG